MNIIRCPFAPKKGGLKTQNGRFTFKIGLRLKKVCYKVSFFCENCQRQSCKAFIGLTIRTKMIDGDVPFCVKIWSILTHPLAKRRFSIYFYNHMSNIYIFSYTKCSNKTKKEKKSVTTRMHCRYRVHS